MKKVKPKISKNKKTGLYEARFVHDGTDYVTTGDTIRNAIYSFIKIYGKKFGMG